MMHDFSLTERHVVFHDLPVTLHVRQATEMTVPRGLRLPARIVSSALIEWVWVAGSDHGARAPAKDADRRFRTRGSAVHRPRCGIGEDDEEEDDEEEDDEEHVSR
jgi:carotenoid cleavage dioxygenase